MFFGCGYIALRTSVSKKEFPIQLNYLDSRFRGNDENGTKLTFYEIIESWRPLRFHEHFLNWKESKLHKDTYPDIADNQNRLGP